MNDKKSRLKEFAKDNLITLAGVGTIVGIVAVTTAAMKKEYRAYLRANNYAYVKNLEIISNAVIDALVKK